MSAPFAYNIAWCSLVLRIPACLEKSFRGSFPNHASAKTSGNRETISSLTTYTGSQSPPNLHYLRQGESSGGCFAVQKISGQSRFALSAADMRSSSNQYSSVGMQGGMGDDHAAVDLRGSDAKNPLYGIDVPTNDDDFNTEAELGIDDDEFPIGQMSSSYVPPSGPAFGDKPVNDAPNAPSRSKIDPNASFWKLDYYRSLWDANDSEVAVRLMRALNPAASSLYASDEVSSLEAQVAPPKPELCGPFWVTTTLVILLAILGNLSVYFDSSLAQRLDVKKLAVAASVLYMFLTVVPTLMWICVRQLEPSVKLVELVSVYGYSLAVFIPASVVAVVNFDLLRWLVLLTAWGCSLATVAKHVLSRLSPESGWSKRWVFLALLTIPHLAVAIYIKFEHFP